MASSRHVLKAPAARVAAAIATAGLLVLSAAPAIAESAPAGYAATAHTATPKQRSLVTVRIRFATCRACRLRMQSFVDGAEWASKWKAAHHRRIAFHVSERHARGSVFLIKAPWVGALPYQPLVAMHYRGHVDGELISGREASRAKRATACWVGTNDAARLSIRTARFDTATTSGDPAVGIRAWTRRTHPKLGRYLLTDQGAVGTQDVVACGNP